MAKHRLTELEVRKAPPKARAYRMADGDGLYLLVLPSGVKSWQYRYRHDGKQQTATLGKLARLGLREARERAEPLRKLAHDGHQLTDEKRAARVRKSAETATRFDDFAERWIAHEARRLRWTADYRLEVKRSITGHLSTLRGMPLVQITAPIAVAALRPVERTSPMMAEKVRRRLRAILDYAHEEGILNGNPLPARRRGPKVDRRHYPAVTDLPTVGDILRNARAADPAKGIARAHVLVTFTAQRIAEVVGARWQEFDLEGATWSIPRERMKIKDPVRGPHLVPLPKQLLSELRAWREADGPGAVLACPAPRDPERPITPEGVEKHYREALGLAGKHSPHSWRAAFKTICANAAKDSEVIEAQLDHVVGNKVAAAYDRADRLEPRRKLMAWYEGQLLAARDGAKVLRLDQRKVKQ